MAVYLFSIAGGRKGLGFLRNTKPGVLFTFNNTDFVFWGWEKACLTKSVQVNAAYKAVITPETRLDVTYTRLARRVHASLIFRAYCL